MSLKIHGETEEKMKKTLKVLKEELASVRAGRANPALLDKVVVEYYGTPTPLKQLANVTAPEPRLLLIQPYDTNVIGDFEKAILKSDLGLNPNNDGKVIRLVIPQLTEERRKELVKLVKKFGENSKVALRNERRNANEEIKKMRKNAELTEDDEKKAQQEIQKMTDNYVKKIDGIIEGKEKEIMEV